MEEKDVEAVVRDHFNPTQSKWEQSRSRQCEVDGCDRPHLAKGYCAGHYSRVRKKGHPESDRPLDLRKNAFGDQVCGVKDCLNFVWALGYCRAHYSRLITVGDVQKDRPLAGTGRINDDGYREIFVGESFPGANGRGMMLEHRFVMSRHLGRPLLDHEEVHHKFGVRDDNRIEHLELWSTSHPAGQRIEDKVIWAEEILDTYAPKRLAKS